MKTAFVFICSVSLLFMGFASNNDVLLDKHTMLNKYSHIVEKFGRNVLTKDSLLTGKRVLNKNSNIGRYNCRYDDFTNNEVLFGSCKVNRNKEKINLSYKVNVEKGRGKLICKNNGEVKTINLFEDDGFKCGEISMSVYDGDFYIGFIGDHFTGSLNLISKEV